jgi:serine/threonine protein kinase/Tol biopolymer transport system component
MSITPGSRIGPYEVKAPLGEGGMGVVYRARDTQLQRQVALKLLPDHFADDPDRLNRFEREAQVLAALNHPNIAQIYGLEKSGTASCIVMELVEGETLADQLRRGPLPLDEAVEVAKQIVDALAAAHERGIVHRDLKPANIKRTSAGAVKILDFGLAKAPQNPLPGEQGFSNSPTMVSGSMAGMILGTAPYMSPEQARGKSVDARTDIWAFGCVLYEMLTGRQTFTGETTTDILAKVLEGQPKWEALPAETPLSIRMLLETTLTKDPKLRLQHIDDAKVFLSRPATLDKSAPEIIRDRRSGRGWIAAAVGFALAFAVALVPASRYFMRTPAELPVVQFEIPEPGSGSPPVISPDGQRIAYVATDSGKTGIWIRPIGSLAAQFLTGTENAAGLFWAPDSRRLAFFADGRLKKTDITGGGVQTLCDTAAGLSLPGTWNKDSVILFGTFLAGASVIARIPDGGGEPTPVTSTDPSLKEIVFAPKFLPDGVHFLFHASNGQNGSVYIGSLDSKSVKRLMVSQDLSPAENFEAEYAQGYLLFSRDRRLLAQPFDPEHLTLSGEPSPVAENVRRNFSVSETGVLVYRTARSSTGRAADRRLSWLDRKGNPAGEISPPANVGNVQLFHDGRIAMDATDPGSNSDIWVLDSRAVPDKLTADNPNFDGFPVWSPDGKEIVFASDREKKFPVMKLYRRFANGAGTAEPLFQENGDVTDIPQDWSTNGIVFQRLTPSTFQSNDIWILSMPDKKPSSYLHDGFVNGQAQVSPNGRYIAFSTNASGSFQIVVQTFPVAGGKWPITAQGGTEPLWKRDGRELYYLAPNGKIMAVSIKSDPTLQVGQTTELFQSGLPPQANPSVRRYAVTDDGQRFLIAGGSITPASGDPIPITAVVNWTSLLRKK